MPPFNYKLAYHQIQNLCFLCSLMFKKTIHPKSPQLPSHLFKTPTTDVMKAYPTLLAALCGLSITAFAQAADTIYHNGSILTMAGKEPTYVEALAVKDGKIVFTGA